MTTARGKETRRSRLGIGFGIAALALVTDTVTAAQPAETPSVALEEIRADSETRLASRLSEGLPGLSAAVGHEGAIVWIYTAGFADLEEERAMSPTTQIRIGSTSKAITAALAGRLLDADLVDLEAPIALPQSVFPQKQHSLTLEYLLSNRGGIRHYQGAEYVSRKHYQSLTEGLEIFRDDPLLFAPGSEFHYSSYGFNLAAVMLEQAGGAAFPQLLESWVFGPLEMHHSTVDDVTADIPERASFYSVRGGKPIPTLEVDDSHKYPSGGLLSTPSDLVRFGSALLAPGFLSAETLQEITRPRSTASGEPTGYALGWRVREADDDLPYRALHHGGSSMGARSMLVVLPEVGIVVSILTNSDAYRTKEQDAFAIAAAFAKAHGSR